ncbi:MAG: hypothetical protein ACREQI_03505 [Candidatus Binataceae bacterium]
MNRVCALAFAMLWIIATMGGCAERNERIAKSGAASRMAAEHQCAQWAAKTLSLRSDLQIPPKGCACDAVRTAQPFQFSGINPWESVNCIVTSPQGSVEVVCRNNASQLWLLPREFHGSCGGCAVVLRK